MSHFTFQIDSRDGRARRGRIVTPRGAIATPAFMPVGTAGTVKAMLPGSVAATGAEIVLGNTYHLMLRPGARRIADLGGLHRFMNWDGPILTDSGGYQVMSLAALRRISEDGVRFRSHIDGSEHMLGPESSMEIQALLGADIVMAFDECTPFPAEEGVAAESMRLSMRWARRSREALGSGRDTRCSEFSKGAFSRNCERNLPNYCKRSVSTATPSAGSPWARGRRECSRCWTPPPPCCPTTGRAT